jgi:hypothetical protein
MIFVYCFLIHIITINALPVANILQATYSTGVSFSKLNFTTSNACICTCINHPHCLSISVTKLSNQTFYCQLFATYPVQSSQLSPSLTSNVTIYTARALSSVYNDNGTSLTNPKNLLSDAANSWLPIFKVFTGNNQSFLWINSSNLTTLTAIPQIPINQVTSHWFNILISQWNQNSYTPNQVAIALIVNRTIVFDFLIFNGSQVDIASWFSITSLISTAYWPVLQYRTTQEGLLQMKAVYTDSDCTRLFNVNYKGSTSGCSPDFYGYLFVYGGYKDSCIAAVRNMSTVAVPTIFYSPSTTITNGNLSYFAIADGIMGFVR